MKTLSNLRYGSRSVVTDKIYIEDKQKEYQRHLQKLKKIKQQQRVPKFYQNTQMLPYLDTNRNSQEQNLRIRRIQQSKKAHKKIFQIFDETELENKSLYNKLKRIQIQKSHSISHFQMGGSKLKSNYRQEQKKKEILDHNRKLISNIIYQKEKLMSKKDLKKQIKEYQNYKSLHLKLNKQSDQKDKKKKKNIIQQPQMNLYLKQYNTEKKQELSPKNQKKKNTTKKKNNKSTHKKQTQDKSATKLIKNQSKILQQSKQQDKDQIKIQKVK